MPGNLLATSAVNDLPAVEEIALSDKAAVQSAREKLDALTDAQKAVIGVEALEVMEKTVAAAEARIAELEDGGSDEPITFDLSSAVVVVPSATYTYTGKPIAPAPVVVFGNLLNAGTDYEVVYKDNLNAGTATVVVIGKGDGFG